MAGMQASKVTEMESLGRSSYLKILLLMTSIDARDILKLMILTWIWGIEGSFLLQYKEA